MNKRILFFSFAAILLVGGCATVGPPIRLFSQFDAAEAQRLIAPGSNKIVGSALVRQQGGGIVTCAGNKVRLIPVTPYATERMRHIYGSDQKGSYSRSGGRQSPKFEPDYPEYHTVTHTVVCDSQEMFDFDSVADGGFYVATSVTWVIDYKPQGGALMQRVGIRGGERKKIVLSP